MMNNRFKSRIKNYFKIFTISIKNISMTKLKQEPNILIKKIWKIFKKKLILVKNITQK